MKLIMAIYKILIVGTASCRDYAMIAIKGILSIYSYHLEAQGFFSVMPAKAGIQSAQNRIFWIPAFAGMTVHSSSCSFIEGSY